MQFLVDIIPAPARRYVYAAAAAASAAVVVLGQLGIIPADGAEQIAAACALVTTALAHANTPKG